MNGNEQKYEDIYRNTINLLMENLKSYFAFNIYFTISYEDKWLKE